jgi:hypothetical protein
MPTVKFTFGPTLFSLIDFWVSLQVGLAETSSQRRLVAIAT